LFDEICRQSATATLDYLYSNLGLSLALRSFESSGSTALATFSLPFHSLHRMSAFPLSPSRSHNPLRAWLAQFVTCAVGLSLVWRGRQVMCKSEMPKRDFTSYILDSWVCPSHAYLASPISESCRSPWPTFEFTFDSFESIFDRFLSILESCRSSQP
jgi:hypothetical protein